MMRTLCLGSAAALAMVGALRYTDDGFLMSPPDYRSDDHKARPAPYRPPEPDHMAHITKADAKRARKAERLQRVGL